MVLHIEGNRDHPQASRGQQEKVSAEQEAGTERKEQGELWVMPSTTKHDKSLVMFV